MKVLHVKGGRPLGGIGTFLLNISKNIDEIKFDYLLNGFDAADEFDERVDKDSKLFISPPLKSFFKYLIYLKKFYKKNGNNYEIIHIHSPNIVIFNYIYIKKYSNAKVVIHSHNSAYSDNILKSIRNYLIVFPIRFFNCEYIACGEKAAKFLFKSKSEKAELVYNGLELGDFNYDSSIRKNIRNKNYVDEKLVIGHIGNFSKQKNYGFIIKVAEKMKEKNINFIIALIGDGKEKDKIIRKVKQKKLSQFVTFLGKVNNVYEYLHMLDILILPSKFEGFPYVSIEAQALGIPVMMSDKIDSTVKINSNCSFIELDLNIWIKELLKKDRKIGDINVSGIKKFSSKYQAQKLKSYYFNLLN